MKSLQETIIESMEEADARVNMDGAGEKTAADNKDAASDKDKAKDKATIDKNKKEVETTETFLRLKDTKEVGLVVETNDEAGTVSLKFADGYVFEAAKDETVDDVEDEEKEKLVKEMNDDEDGRGDDKKKEEEEEE